MSVKMAVMTSHKKEVADVLKAIACWIETSINETVTIQLDVSFDKKEL